MNTPITLVTASALGLWIGAATVNTGRDIFAGDAGITINSLTVVDGGTYIRQDRTVTGNGAVVAKWEAWVRNVETDKKICQGSGFWEYATGHHQPELAIDAWTGDAGCLNRMIEAGDEAVFQACARYNWSDGAETECTLGFRIEPERG